MALTLPKAVKLSTTDLQRGAIETFVQESSIPDRLPMLTIQATATHTTRKPRFLASSSVR